MPKRSTTERGYGAAHQRLRAQWAPKVATGTVRCARCHKLIRPDDLWDLGHHDRDRSQYQGPEHRSCNRSAGARKGNRRRARARRRTDLRW